MTKLKLDKIEALTVERKVVEHLYLSSDGLNGRTGRRRSGAGCWCGAFRDLGLAPSLVRVARRCDASLL